MIGNTQSSSRPWYDSGLMTDAKLPRLMLAGTGGDCGKTFVALGLTAAWRRRGIPVVPFKKGPDYIDSAWLSLAAGIPAHNLDTWMMGPQAVRDSFLQHAAPNGINLIEGNRGLHDGEDSTGSHSSARLAKLLKTPVVLIIPAVKATRTVAAIVLGLQMLDPDVTIAGILLNRIATARQESVIRAAVENCTGLPVLGAIPRMGREPLPSRHLGLVTPEEHIQSLKAVSSAADIIAGSVDLNRLQSIAENSAPLESPKRRLEPEVRQGSGLKIGFFRSSAFTFYYPENLEAIDRGGAVLVPVDPVNDAVLPDLDAVYIGGGFPETHAAALSANESFRASVAQAARRGLPIWAECGGLIFLCRSVHWNRDRHPMAGVFQADIVLDPKPAGHGYEEVVVDRPNPFLAVGTILRGHEFHYSRLHKRESDSNRDTVFKVTRGTGLGRARDGLICGNTVASYLHLHALGSEEWISGLLRAAADFAGSRRTPTSA
jgi:cobyrinic acid a,c-diamide synthase